MASLRKVQALRKSGSALPCARNTPCNNAARNKAGSAPRICRYSAFGLRADWPCWCSAMGFLRHPVSGPGTSIPGVPFFLLSFWAGGLGPRPGAVMLTIAAAPSTDGNHHNATGLGTRPSSSGADQQRFQVAARQQGERPILAEIQARQSPAGLAEPVRGTFGYDAPRAAHRSAAPRRQCHFAVDPRKSRFGGFKQAQRLAHLDGAGGNGRWPKPGMATAAAGLGRPRPKAAARFLVGGQPGSSSARSARRWDRH